METYSYRTSSRFGSRVRITVEGQVVTITGPRLSLAVYRLWIAAQAVVLALVVPSLLLAVARLDWRLALLTLGLLGLHFAVGGVGAGCLWELQNVTDFVGGRRGQTVTFSLNTIQDVRVGEGWARRGMWLLLLPYYKGIDALGQGLTVSFLAPDGAGEGQRVYALQAPAPDEAQALAALLQGK